MPDTFQCGAWAFCPPSLELGSRRVDKKAERWAWVKTEANSVFTPPQDAGSGHRNSDTCPRFSLALEAGEMARAKIKYQELGRDNE
jgi:hypothetical protein